MIFNKRRPAITALLLITAAVLSSCGLIIINRPDETERPPETTEAITDSDGETVTAPQTATPGIPIEPPDNEKQAKKYLNALTKKDFGGVGVTIATLNSERIIPTDAEQPESEAKLLRNRAVEEKYNTILMTAECASAEKLLDEARTAAQAGMYYADLLDIPSSLLGSFKTADMLMNLKSLPFTDYSSPYYNSDAMAQTSGGYSIYGAAGQFNAEIRDMYCVFFNRAIASEYSFENLYLLVEDGKWTWDIFAAFAAEMNTDIDGDGVLYGGHAFAGGIDEYADMMFASSGKHYFATGLGKLPELNFDDSFTEKFIGTANRLLYTGGSLYSDAEKDAMTAFYDGNLLFYINKLYSASWFVNMSDDWGILPLPKLNESSDYCGCTDDSATVLAVLSNSADIENIGLIMQALNAASYKYISDSYYSYLLSDVLRDNNSLNMLDYLTANIRYDFAFMFGDAFDRLPDASYKLLRSCVKKGTPIAGLTAQYSQRLSAQLEKAFRMPD